MKPLRLVIEGFGPYAARQSLDFADLRGADFFLIHGPTGSGKTTLLDAMAYALYGETSGAGRSGAQMRSQHAEAATETAVRFDFRIGENVYRVERRPEQTIAKKRGPGTTTRPAEAALWRAALGSDPGAGDDGWTPLATKSQTVGAEIGRLLGFSCDQFRQVIVIPQGRFREVLEADSRKREEILETLFGTGRFSRLAEILKDRARELEESARAGEQTKVALLRAHEAETLDALRERHAATVLAAGDADARLLRARADRDAAVAALEQARRLHAAFAEADSAAQACDALAAREPAIAAARTRVALARRAAGLRATHDLLAEARRLATQAERGATDTRTTLPDLQRAVTRAEADRASAAQQQPRQAALAAELHHLASLKPRLTAWERARTDLADALRRASEATTRAERLQKSADAATAALPAAEQRWTEASVARARLPALATERQALSDQLALLARRARLSTALAESENQLRQRAADVDALAAPLEHARRELAAEQARWDGGQAALLASTLAPDTPCPVCGSLHHPTPARGDGLPLPSEARLKSARAAVEAASAKLDSAREITRQAEKRADAQRAELAALAAPAEDAAALQARANDLARQHAELTELVAATPEGWIDTTRRTAEQARAAAAAAETARAEAVAARDRLQADLDALTRDLPEPLRAPGALAERLRAVETEAAALEAATVAAEKDLQARTAALRAAEARLDELDKARLAHAQLAAEREQAWRDALAGAEFADESAWHAAALTAAALAEQERAIEQFNGTLVAARDRLARARAALATTGSAARPDLEAHAATARLAEEEHQRHLADRTRLTGDAARFAAALEQLASLEKTFGEISAAYAVAGRVADAVTGKNALGLTLQRFVLTAFLDDTLIAASARLVKMSRGRYRLERRLERDDLRRAAGLDLDVFDEHTGHSRGVNTLSGGEAFLASLALALGLADVVQSHSGGLRMDALFIDEGFGTLDSEALDEAMKVLMDLRENGRLVGIVSHVPELKERINVRLEVTATRAGSTARFVTV